jgi:site-specific recombinase XerD
MARRMMMAGRKNHPGSIEVLPSGSIRVRLSVAGKVHRFTLKDRTREEARDWATWKHQELKREAGREQEGLPGRVPFSHLLERYEETELPGLAPNTQDTYLGSLRFIRRFFVGKRGDPQVDKIRAGLIHEYLTWRRHTGPGGSAVSGYTLAKDRRLLHRIFVLAETLELRDGNPVARVPAPKVDPRDPILLTPEELDRLLEELEDHPTTRLWVLILAETGARAFSEATWLRWEDVRLEDGFLWIASGRHGRRTKSGKGRWVPLTARLAEELRRHGEERRMRLYRGKRTPWVLHQTGRRKEGERYRGSRSIIEGAAERAELPEGWRLHDLRHRRVTSWLAAGKNPVHVKEAMGHSTIQVTMGYTHLAREHLKSLVEAPAIPAELRDLAR